MERFNRWYEAVEGYAIQTAEDLFPWPLRRFTEAHGTAPAAARNDGSRDGEARGGGTPSPDGRGRF